MKQQWQQMSSYDDDYYCVNEKCEWHELDPSVFEANFKKVQQEAIDTISSLIPPIGGRIIKVGNSFAFGYIPSAIVHLHNLETKRLKAIFFEE